MAWDNSANKESLRGIIKRLEIIQARCPNMETNEYFNEAISRVRKIILALMDNRLKPAVVRRRAIEAYKDPEIELKFIAERYKITTRTIQRWARQEGLRRRQKRL